MRSTVFHLSVRTCTSVLSWAGIDRIGSISSIGRSREATYYVATQYHFCFACLFRKGYILLRSFAQRSFPLVSFRGIFRACFG